MYFYSFTYFLAICCSGTAWQSCCTWTHMIQFFISHTYRHRGALKMHKSTRAITAVKQTRTRGRRTAEKVRSSSLLHETAVHSESKLILCFLLCVLQYKAISHAHRWFKNVTFNSRQIKCHKIHTVLSVAFNKVKDWPNFWRKKIISI